MKINQISPQNNIFLQRLDSIALKPRILYYYGKLPQTRLKTVAIVGARHNTKYGEEIAYQLAYELAKKGVVIVSGLAYGIDSIAHQGVIDANGITVGILGTKIENIYPKAHIKLAERIVELGGVIMSEYKNGDKLHYKTSFLARNRLISGLADIVVVIEAAEKSGSLNTASHALSQGKDLFAVPGDITRKMSEGCNNLIRLGATPYTKPEDLLEILFPTTKTRKTHQLSLFSGTNEEKLILNQILQGVRDGDEIMENLNMEAAVFNQTITLLEIKGKVRALGMNCWSVLY